MKNLGCSVSVEIKPNVEGKPLRDYSTIYNSANFLMDVLAAEAAKYPVPLLDVLGEKDSIEIRLTIKREQKDAS